MYLPKPLVGDIQIIDARVACQEVFGDHVSSDLFFYLCDMNPGRGRRCKKLVVNDNESTSVDSETTSVSQMNTIC